MHMDDKFSKLAHARINSVKIPNSNDGYLITSAFVVGPGDDLNPPWINTMPRSTSQQRNRNCYRKRPRQNTIAKKISKSRAKLKNRGGGLNEENRGIIAVCYRKKPATERKTTIVWCRDSACKKKGKSLEILTDKRWEAHVKPAKLANRFWTLFERGLREEIGLTNFSSAILWNLMGKSFRVTNYWTELGLKSYLWSARSNGWKPSRKA